MKKNYQSQLKDFFTEQDRLDQIDSGKKNLVKKGWNINNTNNTNTKDTTDSNYSKNDLLATGTTSSSFGKANVSAACPQGKDARQVSELMPGVKNMKIDLYNNATPEQLVNGQHNYKLNYQFIFYKGNKYNNFDPQIPVRFGSINNRTDLKYFRVNIEKHSPHYKTCVATNQNIASYSNDLDVEFQSISKLFNKMGIGKGEVVEDISSILIRTKFGYQIVLIMHDKTYAYQIDQTNLSIKQRKSNQIGTVVMNAEKKLQKSKMPSAREIFKD